MKAAYLIYFLFCFENAFSQTWNWAHTGVGATNDESMKTVVDKDKNIYITGRFNSNSLIIGGNTLSSSGAYDIFLAKYDTLGNVKWVKSFGGTGYEIVKCLSVDTFGNVYMSGIFGSPMIVIGIDTLWNNGFDPSFLVKYDKNGNSIWAKSVLDVWSIGGLTNDINGNVYLTGGFNTDSIIFGTTTLYNSLTGFLSVEFFIVKYDSSGTALWAKSSTGNYSEEGTALTVDKNSNVVVTGTFNSDSMTIGSIVLHNHGPSGLHTDIFIASYDTSGTLLWAKSIGGIYDDEPKGITTDTAGNITITGKYDSDTLHVGTDTLLMGYGIFTVQYSPTGQLRWAQRSTFNMLGVNTPEGIAADGLGHLYITGHFDGDSIDFGNECGA